METLQRLQKGGVYLSFILSLSFDAFLSPALPQFTPVMYLYQAFSETDLRPVCTRRASWKKEMAAKKNAMESTIKQSDQSM